MISENINIAAAAAATPPPPPPPPPQINDNVGIIKIFTSCCQLHLEKNNHITFIYNLDNHQIYIKQ